MKKKRRFKFLHFFFSFSEISKCTSLDFTLSENSLNFDGCRRRTHFVEAHPPRLLEVSPRVKGPADGNKRTWTWKLNFCSFYFDWLMYSPAFFACRILECRNLVRRFLTRCFSLKAIGTAQFFFLFMRWNCHLPAR